MQVVVRLMIPRGSRFSSIGNKQLKYSSDNITYTQLTEINKTKDESWLKMQNPQQRSATSLQGQGTQNKFKNVTEILKSRVSKNSCRT